ncbi:MAG: MarR family transcriptional regulator [Candidatus Methanoperedens sp.]|nr:MarR family transcriptional regulator [Candidatus Methanoperedens sp.]
MEIKGIHGRTVFMAALFVSSVFILGIKLLNPTTIQIFVEGSNAAISQIPGFFTLTDVIILIIASFALCSSGMYLLFIDRVENNHVEKPAAGAVVLEERKAEWEDVSRTLKDDEQKIYKAIIDSDGLVNQSELTEKTELSKSNISRALDLLESKGLVERRRRGMGNIVLLK